SAPTTTDAARRTGGSSELREMLAAYSRDHRARWDAAAARRHPDATPLGGEDRERALLAGEQVAVSAGELFRVLSWAGRHQEAKRYRFDGPDYRARFVLVGDRLEVKS
ncbi:hypothetical protein, partial [Gordonia sp. ABSL49_1]|uniref:hypothetical protein n=1 Tax=Gordonia sp. ABSL49_1 TaxID=2920941 RepID=UPI001F0DE7C5